MAYDKADWHSGGDYPEELPEENGGTHIGMFIAWAVKNNLVGNFHRDESADELELVRLEKITGRDFLFKCCDGKFWEEDLNEEGNAFAQYYYESDLYLEDYEVALSSELDSLYYVNDSWSNFHKLSALITKSYSKWKNPKKWWEFWK